MEDKEIRVLIIEDSRAVGATLSVILSLFHLVAVARNGADALRAVETLRPDVITMDLNLPDCDGLDLTRTILARQQIPIVVVSSQIQPVMKTGPVSGSRLGENGEKGMLSSSRFPLIVSSMIISMTFWVPEKLPGLGMPISFSYTMSWEYPDKQRPPGGRTVATYTAKGKADEMQKFVIDFAGGRLDALPADNTLTASITVDNNAKLVEQQVFNNQVTGGWRLVFQIQPADQSGVDRVPQQKRQPIELRAFLKDGNNILTETWSYTYLP